MRFERVLIAALRQNLAQPGLQEQGFCKLTDRILKHHPDFFVQEGGIALVVMVLDQYPTRSDLQEYGCRMLYELASNADYQLAIAKVGGWHLVQKAMAAANTKSTLKKWGKMWLDSGRLSDDQEQVAELEHMSATGKLVATIIEVFVLFLC